MTIVPVRDVGKLGVNTDWESLDLPVTAWTMAVNARFVNDTIKRGPVFSTLGNLTANTEPRFSISYKMLNASSEFLVLNRNGTIYKWQASIPGSTPTETDVSIAGFTPSNADSTYTSTLVNGVVYVNRNDRVPWYKLTDGTTFATLPVWDSTWRCESLRSIAGVLVAINVTKGSTKYPTMVKTSDFTTFGSTPGAWTASTTNSATENVIADLQDPLIDGCPLRDRLILYAANETWAMEYRGDNLMFNYRRLFNNKGVLSQNCVAEVNNTHYVFGSDDIWTHDGYQQKSISLGRVRDFIFNNIIRAEVNQCFVVNNPKLGEVMFCYVSSDPYCHFPAMVGSSYPGCNRAAVYNWIYDTWYFYDLPYIVGGTLGLAFSGLTYGDAASLTYDSTSGSYDSLFDSSRLYLNTVSRGATHTSGTLSAAVRMFEPRSIAGGISVLDAVATAPVLVENKQMDLDDISKDIRGYKIVTSMYPTVTFEAGAPPATFTWGSADYSNVLPVYGDAQTFDGSTYYKLDFKSPGRFLSLKLTYEGTQDFNFSGFDIDYSIFGHR